jgi:hypothetical protein
MTGNYSFYSAVVQCSAVQCIAVQHSAHHAPGPWRREAACRPWPQLEQCFHGEPTPADRLLSPGPLKGIISQAGPLLRPAGGKGVLSKEYQDLALQCTVLRPYCWEVPVCLNGVCACVPSQQSGSANRVAPILYCRLQAPGLHRRWIDMIGSVAGTAGAMQCSAVPLWSFTICFLIKGFP